MHHAALNLGRMFDKPRGHRGGRPRAGVLLAAGLIASGVVQLPSSAVGAPAMATRDSSINQDSVRTGIANPTPARSLIVVRPRLSVDDDTVFEGDDATFELRLSKSSHRRVTVQFFTEDGSASGGSDYDEVAGSRSFRPGTKRASVSVETFKDRRDEGDQTFFLHLFRARGANLVDSRGEATIIDRNNNPQPCHPRCNPPCHPKCPPPCHP
jgi:hypothetical protein